MTMANLDRRAGFDRDDRRDRAAAPGSLPLRLAEAALRNPVTTGGVVVSMVMIAVTFANAMVNQPGRHPHPFFETRSFGPARTGTTPAAAPAVAPQPAATQPNGTPWVLPRPKPVGALDDGLVRDLQTALADRGFYSGPVDGVVGPATAEAIRACERRLGTTPTGEPSELLLAALRASSTLVADAAPPAQPMPLPQTAAPAKTPAKTAAKTPAPAPAPVPPQPLRAASADAIAYPASNVETADVAEVEPPVFTGSIRRAAREPLAPGGDPRLQSLQRALIASGYGPLKANGLWDEHSSGAVRRYETDRHWPVTGKPSDKLVWDLMGKATPARR